MNKLDEHYGNVLDLCAGDGEITVKLSNISDIVYSLDNDPIRINRINDIVNSYDINNVKINCCSATSLPYKSDVFDLVVCNSALEHIRDYKKVISEIYRVIKPDGKFVLTVPNSDFQFGQRFKGFWGLILKLPVRIKKIICRNQELAGMEDITSIQEYYDIFFKHLIRFNEEKLSSDLENYFEIDEVRYYMNYLGAWGHDCAYYFRWGKQKILLYLCLLACTIEYRLYKKSKGKGIMMLCRCKKGN